MTSLKRGHSGECALSSMMYNIRDTHTHTHTHTHTVLSHTKYAYTLIHVFVVCLSMAGGRIAVVVNY